MHARVLLSLALVCLVASVQAQFTVDPTIKLDCVVSAWTDPTVGSCSATCGGGVRKQLRQILVQPQNGGKACPALTQTVTCNEQPCPVNCVVTSWAYYETYQAYYDAFFGSGFVVADRSVFSAQCSRSCGGGVRTQVRKVVQYSQYGGTPCPALTQDVPCNTESCPVNCVVGDWAVFDTYQAYQTAMASSGTLLSSSVFSPSCSVSCGSGTRIRFRPVLTRPQHGGADCPNLSSEIACNTQACPGDCVVSNWEYYDTYSAYYSANQNSGILIVQDSFQGSCSASCGGGVRTQYRRIIQREAAGGKACPALSQTIMCNTDACPKTCSLGPWTAFNSYSEYTVVFGSASYAQTAGSFTGACSASCGQGYRTEYRQILTAGLTPSQCGPVSRQVDCNLGACPVDCQVGEWAWYDPTTHLSASVATIANAACSVTCGGGFRTQIRNIITYPARGGVGCPETSRQVSCNTQACPGDCVVGEWTTQSGAQCTKSCGGGVRNQLRVVITKTTNSGVSCPALSREVECNTQPCPLDCVVSEWAEYENYDAYAAAYVFFNDQLPQESFKGTCSRSCGSGIRTVYRRVTQYNAYGGKDCPTLAKTLACNTQACVDEYVLGEWAGFDSFAAYASALGNYPGAETSSSFRGICSVSCGGGVKTEYRPIVHYPVNGNGSIPTLTRTVVCNTQTCPGDCVVSQWTQYSSPNFPDSYYQNLGIPKPTVSDTASCTASCGGGAQTVYRTVITPASYNGKQCPTLTKTIPCNSQPCPVDCVVSQWALFDSYTSYILALGGSSQTLETEPTFSGLCSKSCGGGLRAQYRRVITPAAYGGVACPALSQLLPCNSDPCSLDCIVSDWVDYGPTSANLATDQYTQFHASCTKTCGSGVRTQVRKVVSYPSGSGKPCPVLIQSVTCNTQACPVDCVVSDWAAYETFSAYKLDVGASGPLTSAGAFQGTCSATCGGGVRTVYRKIVSAASNGGQACPALAQTVACNTDACPKDCVVSGWVLYNSYEDYYNQYRGSPSIYDRLSFRGTCSNSCGGGSRLEYRKILSYPSLGGKQCPSLTKSVYCNTQPCPVDCIVSLWTPYNPTGVDQPASPLEANQTVFLNGKPFDGVCSKSCGTGLKTMFRRIIQQSSQGGAACPSLKKDVPCNVQACPGDCVVSAWSIYGPLQISNGMPLDPCTKTCGGGSRTIYRVVTSPSTFNGEPCPALTSSIPCNTQPCPVDCEVGGWTSFESYSDYQAVVTATNSTGISVLSGDFKGACSASCGTGTKSLYRVVVVPPNGGAACPVLSKQVSCNTQECPVDCEVSSWSYYATYYSSADYSSSQLSCTKTCGGGTRTLVRKILRYAANGGKACPTLSLQVPCNTQACPIDCEVSSWSAFTDQQVGGVFQQSACSVSCGGGQRTLYRTVLTPSQFGGQPCPVLQRTVACSSSPCPRDCILSAWSDYRPIPSLIVSGGSQSVDLGSCSTTCGGGTRSQYRQVIQPAAFGGVACGELTQEVACNQQPCPQDCIVSQWTAYASYQLYYDAFFNTSGVETRERFGGICTKSCAGGTRTVYRRVLVPASNGGKACPSLIRSATCNTQQCPVDCVVSSWVNYGSYETMIEFSAYFGLTAQSELKSLSSTCSATCGGGSRSQVRKVITHAAFGGKECGSLTKNVPCNEQPCPVDCQVSQWAEFQPELTYNFEYNEVDTNGNPYVRYDTCSRSCGNGTKTLTRRVVVSPQFGGKQCPTSLSKIVTCNTQPCPVNCVVSDWTFYDQYHPDFQQFGICSTSCGGGQRQQYRNIVVQPAFGGVACPSLTQTLPCNTQPCPVDCVVSPWFYYDQARVKQTFDNTSTAIQGCSKSCGGGSRILFRVVVSEASYGGATCPALSLQQTCNIQPCPVNCVVSEWSDFGPYSPLLVDGSYASNRAQSSCSATCGGGERTQFRSVVVPAAYDGKACPDLTRQIPCNIDPCPVDCTVTAWSSFESYADYVSLFSGHTELEPEETFMGSCTKTCAGGQRGEHRYVVQNATHGGADCPELFRIVPCNEQACPIDCEVTSWAYYDSTSLLAADVAYNSGAIYQTCSRTCGGGLRTQIRKIVRYAANGGAACPNITRQLPCNTDPCPGDCTVSSWAYFPSDKAQYSASILRYYGNPQTKCSATCGDGTVLQYREVLTPQLNSGKPCPELVRFVPCMSGPCPVNCVVSSWTDYQPSNPDYLVLGTCSKSCGNGLRTQFRTILVHPGYNGIECPPLTQQVSCNIKACPVDCQTAEWSSFDSYGQYQSNMGSYGAFETSVTFRGSCSVSCGNGVRTEYRPVTIPPSNGGKLCPTLTRQVPCNAGPCPGDCVVGEWAYFGSFQSTDLTGNNQPSGGQVKNLASCSKTCGGGVQLISRQVIKPAAYTGAPCPSLTKELPCNEQPCPVDCEVTSWAQYNTVQEYIEQLQNVSAVDFKGICTKSCGGGIRTIYRKIVTQASFGGRACPVLTKTESCGLAACPVDCVVSSWSYYLDASVYGTNAASSVCSKSCGSGVRAQYRTVQNYPINGGLACPVLHREVACNVQLCPVDCEVSSWSQFTPENQTSQCSVSCGGGTRLLYRTITVQPNGGKSCPPQAKEVPCNDIPCPVDCVVSQWGYYDSKHNDAASASLCSTSCGGGLRTQYRKVLVDASNGGKQCPLLSREVSCNTQDCPVDCLVSPWALYASAAEFYAAAGVASNDVWTTGSCSKSCGTGVRAAYRKIIRQPLNGGLTCPELIKEEPCNESPCPGDCTVSEWTFFDQRYNPQAGGPTFNSECSQTCGGGTRPQYRKVLVDARNDGEECPSLTRVIPCNEQECPQDCAVSEWAAYAPVGSDFVDLDNGGGCTVSCGGGSQIQYRTVTQHPKGTGKVCPTLTREVPCNTQVCSKDCVVSDWALYATENEYKAAIAAFGPFDEKLVFGGVCSVSCGGGVRTRYRRVLVQPTGAGKECPALTQLVLCNENKCPTDCVVSEWSTFSGITSCSKTCGGGVGVVTRTVVSYPVGGVECPVLTKTLTCGTGDCPTDCVVSDWYTDSTCSASCGGGFRAQARKIVSPATNGGKACPALSQVIPCNTAACPVDCAVSAFKLASDCSKSCGTGVRTFARAVLRYPSGTGQPCPALTMEEPCNEKPCIVDCAVTDWAEFGELSQCTKSCDGGLKFQYRKVLTQPSPTGVQCPALSRQVDCNTQSCSDAPVDCQVSQWTLFNSAEVCSAACGGGTQSLKRTVLRQPTNGGKTCPALFKQAPCNTFSCECPSPKCGLSCQSGFLLGANGCPVCECTNPCDASPCGEGQPCLPQPSGDKTYTCSAASADAQASVNRIMIYIYAGLGGFFVLGVVVAVAYRKRRQTQQKAMAQAREDEEAAQSITPEFMNPLYAGVSNSNTSRSLKSNSTRSLSSQAMAEAGVAAAAAAAAAPRSDEQQSNRVSLDDSDMSMHSAEETASAPSKVLEEDTVFADQDADTDAVSGSRRGTRASSSDESSAYEMPLESPAPEPVAAPAAEPTPTPAPSTGDDTPKHSVKSLVRKFSLKP